MSKKNKRNYLHCSDFSKQSKFAVPQSEVGQTDLVDEDSVVLGHDKRGCSIAVAQITNDSAGKN